MSATPASRQLSVIVPVYKEAANIQPFLERMVPVLQGLAVTYEIIFCMDPASDLQDQTEAVIREAIEKNPSIRLIVFSRRFGQPAATMAGLFYCCGDAALVIDVDLQDPPELLVPLYQKLQEGYEVVYAKRRTREGETWIKKMIASVGYRVIARFSDVSIPRNTGDFRIMTRRVIAELKKLNESHGFLRGLVAYVGFRQACVEYDRDRRLSGKGNYNRFTGSIRIGLNGLVSFSSRPLQFMSVLGACFSGVSFLIGAWYVFQKLAGFSLTPGLSTTVLVVTFFAGIQLLCLGLMGEYVGRIYDEVKKRPLFIVDRVLGSDGEVKAG